MMAVHTHFKLTYEDYLLIPNDGKRHELLDGEHFMTPSPNTKHQRIVGNLYYALRTYLADHRLGEIFVAPYDVVLSFHDVCEPDLVFVSKDQASIVTSANIQGVPTLVVEVLSDGSRKLDETYKRDRYEQAGIKEYWIVDPEIDVVKMLRLGDSGYGQPIELRLERKDELISPLLEAFRLPLTTLFE
jgi:Uma2 family endonuclease